MTKLDRLFYPYFLSPKEKKFLFPKTINESFSYEVRGPKLNVILLCQNIYKDNRCGAVKLEELKKKKKSRFPTSF